MPRWDELGETHLGWCCISLSSRNIEQPVDCVNLASATRLAGLKSKAPFMETITRKGVAHDSEGSSDPHQAPRNALSIKMHALYDGPQTDPHLDQSISNGQFRQWMWNAGFEHVRPTQGPPGSRDHPA